MTIDILISLCFLLRGQARQEAMLWRDSCILPSQKETLPLSDWLV